MLSDRKKNRIRSQTSADTICEVCKERMAITSSGLLCLSGHGGVHRSIAFGHSIKTLKAAWPELVSDCPADHLEIPR